MCPKGVDYIVPEENYQTRWTLEEKKSLLKHNTVVDEHCD